jgi:hypothetical protein
MAAIGKSLDLGLLPKAPSLWNKFNKSIETDIPSSKVPGLALLARKVSLDNVVTVSVGDAVVDCPQGGAAYLCTVPERVEEMKRLVFFDPKLKNEAARIEIQNSTGRPGMAANTINFLIRQGLSASDVVMREAPPTPQGTQTIIYDVTGKGYTAEKVAEWLGMPKERIRNGTEAGAAAAGSTADIVIILGSDARLPAS